MDFDVTALDADSSEPASHGTVELNGDAESSILLDSIARAFSDLNPRMLQPVERAVTPSAISVKSGRPNEETVEQPLDIPHRFEPSQGDEFGWLAPRIPESFAVNSTDGFFTQDDLVTELMG